MAKNYLLLFFEIVLSLGLLVALVGLIGLLLSPKSPVPLPVNTCGQPNDIPIPCCDGQQRVGPDFACPEPLPNNFNRPIVPDNQNSYIFTADTGIDNILTILDSITTIQGGPNSKWGNESFILLFQPGMYDFQGKTLFVNFYTSIRGLGTNPGDTQFSNVTITVQGMTPTSPTATTDYFWRDIENLQVNGDMQWYVSQACPLRRIICTGKLSVNNGVNNSWASGGWMSNIETGNSIDNGNQQQFCYKNIKITSGNVQPSNQGTLNIVAINSDISDTSSCTSQQTVTVLKNIPGYCKPWLMSDGIFLPIQSNVNGSDLTPGGSVINNKDIYVTYPTDTVDTINKNIADSSKKAIIFTPGVYTYNQSIIVDRNDFVVFGLGYPIFKATTNLSSIFSITGNNVWINSLILDAGTGNPPSLLSFSGTNGNGKIHDIYTRMLMPEVGVVNSCQTMITLNQNNTYVENIWLWVADHQNGSKNADWSRMNSPNGLTVNGDNVTICGLAVEHQNDVMTQWNGEYGQCYFYQSEFPYAGSVTGNPSYVVNSTVKNHIFKGGGAYFVLWTGTSTEPSIDHVMEFPQTSGVTWESIIGANWSSYRNIKNVVKYGETVLGSVGEGNRIILCDSQVTPTVSCLTTGDPFKGGQGFCKTPCCKYTCFSGSNYFCQDTSCSTKIPIPSCCSLPGGCGIGCDSTSSLCSS